MNEGKRKRKRKRRRRRKRTLLAPSPAPLALALALALGARFNAQHTSDITRVAPSRVMDRRVPALALAVIVLLALPNALAATAPMTFTGPAGAIDLSENATGRGEVTIKLSLGAFQCAQDSQFIVQLTTNASHVKATAPKSVNFSVAAGSYPNAGDYSAQRSFNVSLARSEFSSGKVLVKGILKSDGNSCTASSASDPTGFLGGIPGVGGGSPTGGGAGIPAAQANVTIATTATAPVATPEQKSGSTVAGTSTAPANAQGAGPSGTAAQAPTANGTGAGAPPSSATPRESTGANSTSAHSQPLAQAAFDGKPQSAGVTPAGGTAVFPAFAIFAVGAAAGIALTLLAVGVALLARRPRV